MMTNIIIIIITVTLLKRVALSSYCYDNQVKFGIASKWKDPKKKEEEGVFMSMSKVPWYQAKEEEVEVIHIQHPVHPVAPWPSPHLAPPRLAHRHFRVENLKCSAGSHFHQGWPSMTCSSLSVSSWFFLDQYGLSWIFISVRFQMKNYTVDR